MHISRVSEALDKVMSASSDLLVINFDKEAFLQKMKALVDETTDKFIIIGDGAATFYQNNESIFDESL